MSKDTLAVLAAAGADQIEAEQARMRAEAQKELEQYREQFALLLPGEIWDAINIHPARASDGRKDRGGADVYAKSAFSLDVDGEPAQIEVFAGWYNQGYGHSKPYVKFAWEKPKGYDSTWKATLNYMTDPAGGDDLAAEEFADKENQNVDRIAIALAQAEAHIREVRADHAKQEYERLINGIEADIRRASSTDTGRQVLRSIRVASDLEPEDRERLIDTAIDRLEVLEEQEREAQEKHERRVRLAEQLIGHAQDWQELHETYDAGVLLHVELAMNQIRGAWPWTAYKIRYVPANPTTYADDLYPEDLIQTKVAVSYTMQQDGGARLHVVRRDGSTHELIVPSVLDIEPTTFETPPRLNENAVYHRSYAYGDRYYINVPPVYAKVVGYEAPNYDGPAKPPAWINYIQLKMDLSVSIVDTWVARHFDDTGFKVGVLAEMDPETLAEKYSGWR